MDVLRQRSGTVSRSSIPLDRARGAGARLCLLAALLPLAAAGCVKPLRIEDLDASLDAATDDARADDVSPGPDAADLDASPPDAPAEDTSSRDAGGARVPTSCTGAMDREDCETVLVEPSETFCVGVDATAENAGWNASPPICGLSLSPFLVDRTEVSVARFRAFHARWRAGELTPTTPVRFANGLVYDAPLPPRDETTEWSPLVAGCNWSDTPDAVGDRHPMNCVGWSLAMYFCAWEGGHLLTSTQYEYLARWHLGASPSGRTFPWGDSTPTCDVAHFAGCTGDDGRVTRRVGAIALAPQGVFDLAGNVADFVADDFAAYATLEGSTCWTRARRDPLCLPSLGGAHYARGSNFMSTSEALLRSVFRPSTALDVASPVRGFRCAYLAP